MSQGMVVAQAYLSTELRLERPLNLAETLGPMQRGRGDLTMQVSKARAVRVTNTPEGAAALLIRQTGNATVVAEAWGPGAAWSMSHLAGLLGEADDPAPLQAMLLTGGRPENGLLRDLLRLHAGLRIPRSGAIFESLLPSILEQRVTGGEARRSYRDLVRAYGVPAPGPSEVAGGLRTPPQPGVLADLPYWAFHRVGVEMKRASTVRSAARSAEKLDALMALPPAEARVRLTAIPGVGPWTAAETALISLGDADAVSVGDYHIPHQVAYAFKGMPRGDDNLLLELLEPYAGQRGRVIRLIQAAGIMAPRRGPRRPLNLFRKF